MLQRCVRAGMCLCLGEGGEGIATWPLAQVRRQKRCRRGGTAPPQHSTPPPPRSPTDEHYIPTLLAVHGRDNETDCQGWLMGAPPPGCSR
jgi:hypothetical protein